MASSPPTSLVTRHEPRIPDTCSVSSDIPMPPPSHSNHHRYQQTQYQMNHQARSPETNDLSDGRPPHQLSKSTSRELPSPLSTSPAARASNPLPSPLRLPKPDQRFSRPYSLDSPTLYEYPPGGTYSSSPTTLSQANLTSITPASPPLRISTEKFVAQTDFSDLLSDYDDLISDTASTSDHDRTPTTIIEDDTEDEDEPGARSEYPYQEKTNSNSLPSMYAHKNTPPHLNLQPVDAPTTFTEPIIDSPDSPKSGASSRIHKPSPKSPSQASPLATFFGWGSPSPSVTDFSSIPSPLYPSRSAGANDARHSTITNFEAGKPNATSEDPLEYCESYLSTPPPLSASADQIEEMEDELKAITSELASSIRRELDLEDLVDRLQEQINGAQGPGKRSSDYFSDSGYSSAKQSDFDLGKDEVEKVQRKAEQEKASIRVELTGKLQDERSRRKELDKQIKHLAERASQMDLAQINSLDAGDRVKELESTCEDLRRRLSEERQSKTNFEDLLSALKTELQDACNERDNLRDEVLPRLRSRIEGLETEAAEYANINYESSKMQQELQALKLENMNLRSNPDTVSEVPQVRSSRAMSTGLSRSNSVAAGSTRGQRPPGLALQRSSSVKHGQLESREVLAERLKDVEAQRDALHKALKSLLDRQDFQNREHSKKVKALENERQRLVSTSPKKGGFEKDIANLRTEVNVLRHRAEDALEQKWQVEKGLVGLKMDLDRAESEIAMLRSLLQEKDILIPPYVGRSSGSSDTFDVPVTSDSLQQAYKKLQAAYAEALDRIKKIEPGPYAENTDEETRLAIERLEHTLSVATSERDAANQEANLLRARHDSAAARESKSVEAEKALANELDESARQVEQLATQVRQQLATNSGLRDRLAEAVAQGDADRKANSDRIAALQDRLRVLEEQLVAAQTVSEERVARHEDEVSTLREAHNERLRRMNSSPGLNGLRSPRLRSPRKAPLLSPLASPLFPRSPRLNKVRSYEEESEVIILRARVLELEKALSDTETEMQEVVARMGVAQIEVLNLQEEREAAVRETRRIQKALEQEQLRAFQERFRTLQGDA
ncbi:hypothetical protein S40288_01376 [Stachybotrys chartarum IBT 40288]|nr:hypothetical protein S40288_01376 [Stachybotrys chartarum IBT 40288]